MNTASYFNNHVITPALCIAASLILVACFGGGGGGGIASSSGGSSLAKGVFTKTFDTADHGGVGAPFSSNNETKTQFLYTADEVGGSGYINKIRFNRGGATVAAISCPNVTIRLGHTSLAGLTTAFTTNVEEGKGSQVRVLNNAKINIPIGAVDTWFDIALNKPFYYNGVDNLVVEYENSTACSGDQSVTRFNAVTNDRRARDGAVDNAAGVIEHDQVTAGSPLDNIQPWMQFVFAGGDNPVTYGGADPSTWPFNTSLIKVQSLHKATAINGSGPVTAIGFQMGVASVAADYTYTVKMGHTTLAALTNGTDFADNYDVDGMTTVANAATFSLPEGLAVHEWFWLPIPDGVFDYNGNDNLLVEVDVSAATATNSLRVEAAVGYNARLYGASGDITSSAVNTAGYHTRFRFNGGPVSVIDDGALTSVKYFNTAADSIVTLYRAMELGTGGKITSVACRADVDTVAGDYPSYKIVIGHTLVDNLTDETDLISQTTVYTGGYTIPATLLAGDWITIPLTTPYTYDGESNLIIWWGSSAADASTSSNICRVSSTDAVKYPNHVAIGAAPGTTYTNASNHMADVKLTIKK